MFIILTIKNIKSALINMSRLFTLTIFQRGGWLAATSLPSKTGAAIPAFEVQLQNGN